MNPIGGYLGLELREGNEYHEKAIRLNTGRNSLELILIARQYKKVFIPLFTCDVILEPINKLHLSYEFYQIDEKLEPLFDLKTLKADEGFLYTNYFGIKDKFISSLSKSCKNLIIDNAHAFYNIPKKNVDSFNSCRKFFGVPDGAYVYLNEPFKINYPQTSSFNQMSHLIKQIDIGIQNGYEDFLHNENYLLSQPIMQMSKITKALLCNVDYENAKNKRRENFIFLHKKLNTYNDFHFEFEDELIPMVYPFFITNKSIRNKLIAKKIFIAQYWPNVIKWADKTSFEYLLATNLISIPIDQRFGLQEMKFILKTIKDELE